MERLLHLRTFCTEWGNTVIEQKKRFFLLSSTEWLEVERIVEVFKWPNILTEQLQAEQLTLSDVYGDWITMELKLQKETHPLAGLLLEHLRPRRAKILDHEAMSAAVYLDPRFNRLLSVEKRNQAEDFLRNLWSRIINLKGQNDSIHDGAHNGSEFETNFSGSNIDPDLLAHVQSADARISKLSGSQAANQKSITNQLITFFESETIENVQKARGILAYWSTTVRYEYDSLYEFTRVLLSMPATQVSVERAFSALKYILNDYYRTCMSDESLENILLIRLNW